MEGKPGNCSYSAGPELEVRVFLFLIFMPILSFISIFGNIFTIYAFSRPTLRNVNNFFLSLIAACDIGVVLTALMLYTVEVAYDYFLILDLYRLWLGYLRAAYLLSNVFQMASVFYTVAATLERWFCSVRGQEVTIARAKFCALITGVITLLINVIRYFELRILTDSNCTGTMAEKTASQSEFAQSPLYRVIITLWFWSLLNMIFPFFLLLGLNFAIFYRFRQQPHFRVLGFAHPSTIRQQEKRNKERESTVLLISVVAIFLVCNTPGLVLTVAEIVAMSWLKNEVPKLYHFSRDTINLLAVFQCCPNVFIYIAGSKLFKLQLKILYRKITCRARRNRYVGYVEATLLTASPGVCLRPIRSTSEIFQNGYLAHLPFTSDTILNGKLEDLPASRV